MANRVREKQVKIRMSEEEYALFQSLVEQSGMSQQSYLLNCALNKPITNTDGIKAFVPELKRVGNNLNQVAKELHGRGYYQYNLITENQKELKEIWQHLKQFLQNVG